MVMGAAPNSGVDCAWEASSPRGDGCGAGCEAGSAEWVPEAPPPPPLEARAAGGCGAAAGLARPFCRACCSKEASLVRILLVFQQKQSVRFAIWNQVASRKSRELKM